MNTRDVYNMIASLRCHYCYLSVAITPLLNLFVKGIFCAATYGRKISVFVM